jgi:putative DNA-invertase from lambdoid prophage Rac
MVKMPFHAQWGFRFTPVSVGGAAVIYAYVRISTSQQNLANQRYELLNYAGRHECRIDVWTTETVSGAKAYTERELGALVNRMGVGDTLLVVELSRLGRSLMEVMSILHRLMERQIKVISVTEGLELGDTINAKVLAFAFSLAAEIERNLIAARTREALARKKQEGQRLGRPKGSLSKKTKLTGRDDEIRLLLGKKVAVAAVARIMGVHRRTMANYIKSRRLVES